MSRYIFALGLLASACTPFAVAPPVRAVPQETTQTLAEGRVAVAGSAGYHLVQSATGFASATGRVRYGLIENTELSLGGTWMYFEPLAGERPASEHAFAGHVGIKQRIETGLAFTAGFGGGVGPWGGFLGPDLGFILAYENPHVVPFFAVRGQVSIPVLVSPERIPSNDMTADQIVEPYTTIYFQPSIGLRIPLCHGRCDIADVALTVAASYTHVYVVEPEDRMFHVWGGETGLELEL